MRTQSLLLVISLVWGACASDGRRDGETCSGAVSCVGDVAKSYQLCTTDGSSSCRFVAADSTTFECETCASCQATLVDVQTWCGGGTSTPTMHGAILSIDSAQWTTGKHSVVVTATVINQSSLDLTAQPPLFTMLDDAQQIIACDGAGESPVGCSGTGMVAKDGSVSCSLVFSTMTPQTLRFSDGTHSAQVTLDRASIGTFVPPHREDTEMLCRDGKDNNGNGTFDCNDNDSECCNLRPDCRTGTFCCSLSWYRNKHPC